MFKKIVLTGILALGVVPTNVSADCVAAGPQELELWDAHGGCSLLWERGALPGDKWYPLRHHVNYGTDGGDWKDRGFKNACTIDRDYTKHWNATTLIEHGTSDRNNQSWHGIIDYQRTGEAGRDSDFHTSIRTFLDGNYTKPAQWEYRYNPFNRNVIRTGCAIYDETKYYGTPAARASALMHEPWHGWLNLHQYRTDHRKGPQKQCTAEGNQACDFFYFHGVKEYKFGALDEFTRDGKRFHSPYQVQVEYMCDLAQLAEGWVPATMRMDAEEKADEMSNVRFINGPGIKCSNPRPWSLK